MWIAFSLTAALGAAATSLILKQTVSHGGVIVSTVAFRVIAGILLTGVVAATGSWPELTPAYWRAAALVIPPEVAGMVFLTLALRAGDLSLVQPMLGMLPLFVMLSGVVFLDEMPTPQAAVGILLVTAGVYCVGLQPGGSALEPLRALARSRASWYAIGAALFWTVTTMLHKVGIAEVGPFPWAVTLAMGSGLALAASLPVLGWTHGTLGLPDHPGLWARLVTLAGCCFALQQIGLHLALRATQAGYVVAVTATSILWATALGILLLRERSHARNRAIGGLLVTTGAITIALFG
jgi:uncharacterized membrane protein